MKLADLASHSRTLTLAALCGWLDPRPITPPSLASLRDPQLGPLALLHKVQPALHMALSRAGVLDSIPAPLRQQLQQAFALNTRRVLRAKMWLARIITHLKQQGIEARPLKGILLGQQLYPLEVERHCGDIDLLVSPANSLADLEPLLLSQGLVPQRPSDWPPHVQEMDDALVRFRSYWADGDLCVEVHRAWDLGRVHHPPAARIAAPEWEPVEVVQTQTVRLYGARLAVYLLSHGTRSQWCRLKWLLDLCHIGQGYGEDDWHSVCKLGQREGALLHVQVGLRVLQTHFPSISLSRFLRHQMPGFRTGWIVRSCNEELTGASAPAGRTVQSLKKFIYEFYAAESWRFRGWYLCRFLIRRGDYIHLPLPLWLAVLSAPVIRLFSVVYRRIIVPLRSQFNR